MEGEERSKGFDTGKFYAGAYEHRRERQKGIL